MRDDFFGAPTRNIKNLDPSDLILIWRDITQTLISTGHAAELRQALNSASRTGQGDVARDLPSRSVNNCHEESCQGPALSDESQPGANNSENNRSISSFDSEGDDGMSSPDESDIDDNIYNDLDVPSYIIDEATDLSQYGHGNAPRSFEEILAQERSLLRCDGRHAEPEDTAVPFDNDSILSRACTPPSTVVLLPADADQIQLRNSLGQDKALEQSITPTVEAQDSLFEETKPLPPQPTLAPGSRKHSANAGGLRVSDKKDLTPAQIPVVANLLVSKDSLSYFLENCHLLYGGWMPFAAQQPVVCKNSAETSVITALDTVQDLLNGNRICRLLSRFAYIYLAWVVDAYKAVAAADRVQGKASRNVGQRDASVAIDMYLKAKRKASGEQLKRSRLLGYCRTGRRWAVLAGSSPISVFVFPRIAETIVYVPPLLIIIETDNLERQNNSITDSTVQAIAIQIQDNNPELVRILAELGWYAGLIHSNSTHTMPDLEDVVARTNKALGLVLDTISQSSSSDIR